MFNFKPTLFMLIATAATTAVVSGWGGYKATSWYYKSEMYEALKVERDNADKALMIARDEMLEFAKEAKVRQAEAVTRVIQQQALTEKAQEVVNEAVREVDDGSCMWRDVDRMRINSLYSIYGHGTASVTGPDGMLDPLHKSSHSGEPLVPGVVSIHNGLGNGLRASLQGLSGSPGNQ